MAKKSAKKKTAKKKTKQAAGSKARNKTKKKAAKKKSARKKPAAKKKKAKKKKATRKKAVARKVKAGKKATLKRIKTTKKKAAKSLGRPKVTGDEKLFLLFKDDHQARSIFAFLRAQTVRELEAFSPHDIVHRLTLPVRQTVDRIRRMLAEKNRHLADDKQFALEYKAQQGQR